MHNKTINEMPLKLNIGCGWDKKTGFLNVDLNAFHEPDLVADACDLSMLPSGQFNLIVAQDVLEHLEREKTVVALVEWSRLLSLDGIIQIRIPSLFGMLRLLEKPENRPWQNAEKIIHLIYGTQKYNGDYHLAGFTASVLVEYLLRAGLVVKKVEIKDTWLFDIDVVKQGQLKTPEDIVHNAYFEVLGRPVDNGALEYMLPLIRNGALTADQLHANLKSSEEFRMLNRHSG